MNSIYTLAQINSQICANETETLKITSAEFTDSA